MSTSTLTYGNTLLADVGKKGILKPMDDSGYYLMNAGMLNAPLRLGHSYPVNDYIRECMQEGSDLKRRIERGEVYAELGHPKPFYYKKENGVVIRTPITDAFEWVMRLRTIVEDNVCLHIRKIHFIPLGGPTAPVQLKAEVIPFGVHKQIAEDSLNNPDIGTSLSMRTVTMPQKIGDKLKQIEYFTGFDLVWEPGEHSATKYLTAGCESYFQESGNGMDVFDHDDSLVIKTSDLMNAWESVKNDPNHMSRFAGNEDYSGMEELMKRIALIHNADEEHVIHKSSILSVF